MKAEEDAQTAYEDFVKETGAAIEERSKDIVNKSEEKAKAEEDKTQVEADKEETMLELEQLANEALDLHGTCDFVMKNFDIRQTARDEEIETAYEDFVKETNAAIEERSKDIVNKSEQKAKAEADLVQAQTEKEAVMLEL